MNAFLQEHPEIFIPERKELHFFGSDLELRRGAMPVEEYLQHFRGVGDEIRVGESSVWYLYSASAAEEIQAFNPEASIIVMLRHPVDMLYSLHSQMLYTGNEDIECFEDALSAQHARAAGRRIPKTARNPKGLQYLAVARYAEQIKRYFDTFGRDRVHVILFDDFKRDAPGTYRALCAFLGVCLDYRPDFRVINPNKRVRSRRILRLIKSPPPVIRTIARKLVPDCVRGNAIRGLQRWNTSYEPRNPMNDAVRVELNERLRPEILKLAALLDRDLSTWLEPAAEPRARETHCA